MPEILPGVHIVSLAQGLGAPGGAMNVCLLVEGGRITAIDAGLPGSATAILEYVAEIGLAPQDIGRVIITYHHLDHVGGLAELLDRSRAEVWAHRDDAPVIEGAVARPAIPPERIEAMLAAIAAERRGAAAARMKARQIATLGFASFIGYHGGYVFSDARELLGDSLTQ